MLSPMHKRYKWTKKNYIFSRTRSEYSTINIYRNAENRLVSCWKTVAELDFIVQLRLFLAEYCHRLFKTFNIKNLELVNFEPGNLKLGDFPLC